MPVLVRRRTLRPDSGGAGRFRGGLGQLLEFESHCPNPITVRAEHGKLGTPPRGLAGGLPGAGGRILLNGAAMPDKLPLQMRAGDVLTLEVPGSGGMGSPSERDPAAIAEDLADGLVTRAAVLRDHGAALLAKAEG